MAKWAMQTTPHDEWDYDATNEVILFQHKDKKGKNQTYATQVNKNGFIYTWQANNGRLIAAEKVHPFVNWATSVDLKTGVPTKDARYNTHQDVNTKEVCPSSLGAKGMNPAAYSPKTKLLYIPLFHTCMNFEPVESRYKAGQPWVGATINDFGYIKGLNGGLSAYDVITHKSHWFNQEASASTSGLLATAGNLILFNAGNRWFKAVDAANGKLLWQYNVGVPISSNPFSYHHKGKQYIGIMAGLGGIKSIFGQSFWGEPTMVTCVPSFAPRTIDKEFISIDSNTCWNFVTPAARGSMLNIFSL